MDDNLALGLAGREGAALRERLRAELPHPFLVAFSRWMCVRARFPEDIVEQAAADGVRQYVILGAGLDSFAGIAAEMGEPFVSRFLPGEIDQLLREHGFGEIADFGPHEARETYFQGRTDIAISGAQRLIAATVMPAATP